MWSYSKIVMEKQTETGLFVSNILILYHSYTAKQWQLESSKRAAIYLYFFKCVKF